MQVEKHTHTAKLNMFTMRDRTIVTGGEAMELLKINISLKLGPVFLMTC